MIKSFGLDNIDTRILKANVLTPCITFIVNKIIFSGVLKELAVAWILCGSLYA